MGAPGYIGAATNDAKFASASAITFRYIGSGTVS